MSSNNTPPPASKAKPSKTMPVSSEASEFPGAVEFFNYLNDKIDDYNRRKRIDVV